MTHEDAVEPQDQVMNETLDQAVEQAPDVDHEQQAYEKTMVPLSALKKVREKNKEIELELQWERQQRQREAQALQSQKAAEEDNSRYESATRDEVSKKVDQTREEILKEVEERLWIKQNPEKYQLINERLPTFLKQRPNLARAINDASNRYEEAYTLMEALTPKQQQQLKRESSGAPPKREAPNSPGNMPKAAAMDAAVDVMTMSDSEFAAWRASKRKSR